MIKKRKGFALVLSLIVIMVLALLSNALINRYVVDNRSVQTYSQSTRAFWIAEAGAARALWEYNHGLSTWAGWSLNGSDMFLNANSGLSGEYDITVQNYLSANPTVTAIGYFPNKVDAQRNVRTVRAVIGKGESLFQYAAFGESWMKLGGTMTTDSFDSDAGAYGQVLADGSTNISQGGDVGTNGDIIGGGTAFINGDASTGPSGIFNDTSMVSGAIDHTSNLELPYVGVPAYLQSLSLQGSILSSRTLAPGTYKYTKIQLTSAETVTITGPAEIYLTAQTAIKMTAAAAIVIDPASTGPVKIYFDGDIDITGRGIVNPSQISSNVLLVGTNHLSQEVKLSGQEDMYAAFYAPAADLSLGGGADYFGSYIGKTVTSLGTSSLHYDGSLADEDLGISYYTFLHWIDEHSSYAVY